MPKQKIEASTKVSDVMQLYPELTDYLMELGLCGCDYGRESNLDWDMSRVAREKGMGIHTLLNELNRTLK